MLMRTVAFQLLEMVALDRVKVSFVLDGADDLHPLPERLDDGLVEAGCEGGFGFEAVEVFVSKVYFHLVSAILNALTMALSKPAVKAASVSRRSRFSSLKSISI